MIQAKETSSDNIYLRSSDALDSLTRLFSDLNDAGIRYCHWKSNMRLCAALQGETDLDLLVDRKYSEKFRRILSEHKVKLCMAAPGRRYPGLEDYLGYDQASGELFHLHVHYQLILGEQYVKNYRLPIEAQVLDGIDLVSGVKVPYPEIELCILSIRALLKYRDRDVIKDLLKIRSPGIPKHIQAELNYLMSQTSIEAVNRVLSKDLTILPRKIILEFLSTIERNPRDGRNLFLLRRKMRNALQGFQRYNRSKATLIYFKELWHRRNSFQSDKTKGRMTFANGGIDLALIGVDGAGKSTWHQQLTDWLSWKMDIRGYYLGSKQPSWTSDVLYKFFRIFRRGNREVNAKIGENSLITRWLNSLKRMFLFAHHVSIGSDRFKRYRTGKKLTNRGVIILYDRFPLEKINQTPDFRLLDGPQSQISGEPVSNSVSKFLISRELAFYEKMNLPDYLLVLDVNPEISIKRKPDHDPEFLAAKNRAIQDLLVHRDVGMMKQRLIYIDANLPKETVLQHLKSNIWDIL